MPQLESPSSGQPFIEAAALVTLLVEGSRYREQLIGDVRSLVAPWLHPTVAAILASLDRLEAGGGVVSHGVTRLEAATPIAGDALVSHLRRGARDGAPGLLPLAHLLFAIAHGALERADADRLERELIYANSQAFGLATDVRDAGAGSSDPLLHRRARHFRAALAGANLQLLETFAHRVPALLPVGLRG